MTHLSLKQLKEEILLLIRYAVDEEDKDKAHSLLNDMQSDRVALNLLKAFYSYLPEAKNDAIVKLQLLDARSGTFLLLVTTITDHYLYISNLDRAEFLGRYRDGIGEEEVLNFFEMSREEALKRYGNQEDFPEYLPLGQSPTHCTVCSATVGEEHQLGCPIEVCPWCHGQLTQCNCRYEKMGRDKISSQKQLNAFKEILDRKGRVPFEQNQKLGGLRE